MNTKDIIERAEKNLVIHTKIVNLLKDIIGKVEHLNVEVLCYDDKIAIEPYKIEEFHKLNKILRKYQSDYKYTIDSIDSPYSGCYFIRYKTNIQYISIWVKYDKAEDIPKQFTKGGKCRFKKKRVTQEVFACEIGVSNDR